jgi:conjugal transfer mating pair stabilization protein TraN
MGCPPGSTQAFTRANVAVCATAAGSATLQGATGWTLPLSFTKPGVMATTTDTWDNQCPALAANGRCSVATADVCSDGPSTKTIDGVPVSRPCWQYQSTLTCANGAPADDCAPLAALGCTPVSSTCQQLNPATGACEITQATYQCPVAAQATTSVANCPATQLCLGGTCFPTTAAADTDFAHALSMLEAAREAGVYLNTSNLQVFAGESDSCRNRLLKNCCATNSAGAGMSNQSLFGVGSRLVFDVLMNASDRQFIAAGVKALLLGGGFSGSFTTYGVTLAVNGSAIPAGSVALTSTGDVVIAVDPWSLSVSILLYSAMSLTSCNSEEGLLAMKEGASLCHTVGTYWSDSLPLIGCIELTTGKCCFNSLLARLINEQGRAQIGKGWGGASSPDCSGFSIAQLQSLNFAAMDLSAFYASLVPTLPNTGAIQTQTAAQVPTCYYGQGKCQ